MFWKKKNLGITYEPERGKFAKVHEAIRLLHEVGLSCNELYCSDELALEMTNCRKAMDAVGCTPGILRMDTTWGALMCADEYANPVYKKIYKDRLVGQIFGIQIVRK